jgi:demethylmenaquinone methyltransferase/2-methoxy-6-polyprenyl-1,4-benzoquinol methylase
VDDPVSKAPDRIAGMFDAIALRYDLLNHLLSAGIDRRWRSRAVRALALKGGEQVLDLCTGTGDLAIAAATAALAPRASLASTSPAPCSALAAANCAARASSAA